MVCVYCGGHTEVVNSRLQKRWNQVWRRRRCSSCSAVFSTHETVEYEKALSVQALSGRYTPFLRDKLFLSVYKSCGHRKSAITDAEALTSTIIGKLIQATDDGKLASQQINCAVLEALKYFDSAAATHYRAFHPENTK